MSGVFDSLFGGQHDKSQQQSSSSNQAYPYLQGALSPEVSTGAGANHQIASLLGLNGATGQNAAFDNYKASAGYQNGLNTGAEALSGNQAARGLLGSGSTATGLDAFGQNYANKFLNDYLQNANTVTTQGNQAAGTIGSSGFQSSSTGSSSGDKKNGGLGSFLGAFL